MQITWKYEPSGKATGIAGSSSLHEDSIGCSICINYGFKCGVNLDDDAHGTAGTSISPNMDYTEFRFLIKT